MKRSNGRRSSRGHGIVAVLAMMYLMLFSVLAVGFYAACALSVQIATNERSAADAQSAAESGMQWARLQLASVNVPPAAVDDALLTALARGLAVRLNASPSMNGHAVEMRHNLITLPADDDSILLSASACTRFQVQVTCAGPSAWVKVTGWGSNPAIKRAIQMRFDTSTREGDTYLTAVPASYEEVMP